MGTESRRYVMPTLNFEFRLALRERWRLGVISSTVHTFYGWESDTFGHILQAAD
jgi:hypothetical protein